MDSDNLRALETSGVLLMELGEMDKAKSVSLTQRHTQSCLSEPKKGDNDEFLTFFTSTI